MIKDKQQAITATPPVSTENRKVTTPEEVVKNPFAEMYYAVKRALLTIRENPEVPTSPPFFKTIAIDNGQYLRIIRDTNMEMEVAFPAILSILSTSAIWCSSNASAKVGPPCGYDSF